MSQLRSPFLALPLPLRRMLVEVVCAPLQTATPHRLCGRRCFSSSPIPQAAHRAAKPRAAKPRAAPSRAPASQAAARPADRKPDSKTPQDDVVRALAYLPPPPSADPKDTAADAAAVVVETARTPSAQALDRATALFLRPPARFLYSAPRFLHLPINTRIPEVCIIGRSNVGKSTLLNALAGLETGGQAGRSHGARPGRRGLAITSAQAGCTTMMNGYGFGPPLRPGAPGWVGAEPDSDSRIASSHTPMSRSQRRAQRPGEPTPQHSLVVLDMPGYGFLSRAEWGAEITKVLQRRTALRGAVLLVDAVAGLKEGDLQALALLRDANVRTLVVLTKADKLLGRGQTQTQAQAQAQAPGEPPSPGQRKLHATCLAAWKALRSVERHSWGTLPWMEGQGWEPALCVTGAGDPKGGGFGVAGARLAICRLARLLPPAEVAARTKKQGAGKKKKSRKPREDDGGSSDDVDVTSASQTVVPFDQIQWAETATEAVIDQSEERRYIAEREAAARKPDPASEPETTAEASPAPTPTRTAGRRRPWKRATRP